MRELPRLAPSLAILLRGLTFALGRATRQAILKRRTLADACWEAGRVITYATAPHRKPQRGGGIFRPA